MKGRSERFRTPTTGEDPGVELHCLQWGDPAHPRLVLLHGGGANAHWWDHIAPTFADRFHVVALDFRGHGDSERPRELVPGAFNDDLSALMAHLGFPEAESDTRSKAEHGVAGTRGDIADSASQSRNTVLIGHSMGAHVALEYAARPGRVRGLVLLDPARGGEERRRRRMRLALTFRRTYASREEAVARFRFLPPADEAEEALRISIATASVEQEEDGRWGYKFDPRWFGLRSSREIDPEKVRSPTLIVRGATSGILTDEGARELRDEIPGSQLVVIEGGGHHVQLDRPGPVLCALGKFIETHSLDCCQNGAT